MNQQFRITNHLVDLARNQIVRDQHLANEVIQTLPPKTIAVLTELAKSQGNVVSHDQLMDVVWQNTVVSPNSIQRCITQLRKALSDDGKQQLIIKTHAKQGYSLEVPAIFIEDSSKATTQHDDKPYDSRAKEKGHLDTITSQEKSNESTRIPDAISLQYRKNRVKLLTVCFSVILSVVAIYSYYSPVPRNFSFNTLTPITSSDNLERNASYSPDGKYIIFHRYDGLCDNNIWAKELATAKEHKLTTTYGFYGDHSFTENGEKLTFTAKVSCKDNKKQKACWNLMTLNFAKALKQSQQPELVVSCEQGALSNPVWLNNGNIAALHKQNERWQIVKVMPGAPSFVALYTSNDKNYYRLMYSTKQQHLIALGINPLNEHYIDLISPLGELLSSHLIDRPNVISQFSLIEPIIDPQQDKLVFSTGKRLFTLSFKGEIKQVSTLSHNNLATIKMNESGESIVTVQGVVDTDIAKVNIGNLTSSSNSKQQNLVQHQSVDFNQVRQPYPSLARSIAEDSDAKFQPQGELIAFISKRSGTSQIWIQNKDRLTQLTDFSIDTVISSFSWNPSGVSIMLVANSELFNVSLDKSIKEIPLKFAVLTLYQWQNNNELLMSVRQTGQVQLINYNFSSEKSTTLINEAVKWAVNTELNQTLYLDHNNHFWIKSVKKTLPLEKLKAQFGNNRFVIENGSIYSFNKHKQLWSYSLNTDELTLFGTMDNYTNFISDIQNSELLLTQIIAAKKEVVVLSNESNMP